MRHLESNVNQKNFEESERFMNEIPAKLRKLVIYKTHGKIIDKIAFFRAKNQDFNSAIIYEMKHMHIGQGELLYQQNDSPFQIFFIFQGSFKLVVDLNSFI
jgi:hypothetical protein